MRGCPCVDCRPIIRGESEVVGYGRKDNTDDGARRFARGGRRSIGTRSWRQRYEDWWCSHASQPSWPPSAQSNAQLEPEPARRRRRESVSRYTGGVGCSGS